MNIHFLCPVLRTEESHYPISPLSLSITGVHIEYKPVTRNTMHCPPSHTLPSTVGSLATMAFKYLLAVVLCVASPRYRCITKTPGHYSRLTPKSNNAVQALHHKSQQDVSRLLQSRSLQPGLLQPGAIRPEGPRPELLRPEHLQPEHITQRHARQVPP